MTHEERGPASRGPLCLAGSGVLSYLKHMEQNANNSLWPRYALTLVRLRDWHVLEATCWHCRHVGTVHPRWLRRRYPENVLLRDLMPRLVCSACGNRENNTWEVLQKPRD